MIDDPLDAYWAGILVATTAMLGAHAFGDDGAEVLVAVIFCVYAALALITRRARPDLYEEDTHR